MELAKCLRCEGLFNQLKYPVCQDCERKEEAEIFEVQKYLRDTPGTSLEQASDALEGV